jgi:hypothetical protein
LTLNDDVGTVDYTTGAIRVVMAVKSYNGGYISIYAKTESKDFIVQKSKFIILDSQDFNINVVRARY